LKRFEALLDALPAGCVFDGEIVALDKRGRPGFNDLLFARRQPVVAFDLMVADGQDVQPTTLKERKAILPNIVRRHCLQSNIGPCSMLHPQLIWIIVKF
jgi:ATP-dependent DNA ligase